MRLRSMLFAPALLVAFAGIASAQYAVEVSADALNVRASAMGTVLGQVHRGDQFVARSQQGDWVRIDWQGRGAYVSASFVRRVAADMVTITQDVNVRTGPDTAYGRIGGAAQGQRYVKLGEDSGWTLLQFDSRRAYVISWATSDGGSSSGAQPQPVAPVSQPTGNVSQAELEILARIVKGEAGQCSFEGKVAVAAVVLNRVQAPGFPGTIERVAHQPWQFSCYNANVRNRLYWGPIPQSCWDAARAAVNGSDPSRGATYYFNPYLVLPSWARTMHRTARIGTGVTNTHDFYRP